MMAVIHGQETPTFQVLEYGIPPATSASGRRHPLASFKLLGLRQEISQYYKMGMIDQALGLQVTIHNLF
jgi:hypothetical protein